ncbi:MAG: hypothetical protein K0Q87_5079 [Neobacillus sp.]|nr:hypothetical protein [Neobacillus sp.]
MSFDGLFTKAMVDELSLALKGGRINKVHQPYKNEVILTIRANGLTKSYYYPHTPTTPGYS